MRGVDFAVAARRAVRAARAERRRQDHHHQDAHHPAAADVGVGPGARARRGDDAREVRRRVGYVFGGDRGLYERLSGLDNLRYFAELYARARARAARADRRAARAGRADRPGEGAGRGLLARHAAAAAHRPRPAAPARGAVPRRAVASASTRSVPASCGRPSPALVEQGTTVLLTTHYMFEADELCDRIAVIAGGRIVATGTPGRAQGAGARTARSSRSRCSATPSRPGAWPRALPGRAVGDRRGQRPRPAAHRPRRARGRGGAGRAGLPGRLPIGRVSTREPTLEDAYVELVKRRMRTVRVIGDRLVAAAEDAQPVGLRRRARRAVAAVLRHHRLPDVRRRRGRRGAAVRRRRRQRHGHLVVGQHVGQQRAAAGARRAPWSCSSPRRCGCRWCCCRSPLRWRPSALYSMVATLLWGRFVFGIDIPSTHPLLFGSPCWRPSWRSGWSGS